MFRKKRECKKSLSDFFFFLANSDNERKRQAWGTLGEGNHQLLRIGFLHFCDPNLLRWKNFWDSPVSTEGPSDLSMTFKSYVLDPVHHGPQPWIPKTLKLPSSFLGMGITRSKCRMWEKYVLAPGSLTLKSPPYRWPALWWWMCHLTLLSLCVLIYKAHQTTLPSCRVPSSSQILTE